MDLSFLGKINYLGYSLGTTSMFQYLAENTTANNLIDVFVSMASVTDLKYTRAYFRIFAYIPLVSTILRVPLPLLPSTDVDRVLLRLICPNIIPELCFILFAYGSVGPSVLINQERVPDYLESFPARTQTRIFASGLQLIQAGRFQKFDYGPIKNLAKYG